MKKDLRVLCIEDSEDDALLEINVLRDAGYQPVYERVQTAAETLRMLKEREWDIILCDYCMPTFNAPKAIEIVTHSGKEIPLIIVSGTVGEDVAVDCLQLGAQDYLLKQNLARLVPAVERSLKEKEIHLQRMADEKRLREQAALLDKAQDAILVIDMAGIILYWNKGAERMYGWSSQEATRQSAQDLLGVNPSQIRQAIATVHARGDWSGELEDRTKDGRRIVVESRWTLLRDDNKNPQSVLAINTDITEKKNLQNQIAHAQRLESIGTLTSGIAHDFNNLLTVINGHAEMGLLELPEDDEKNREILQTIHDAGRRAASLTSQLLAFSRKAAMEPVLLQLNEIVLELEKMLRRLIGEDIRLVVRADPELLPIRSDPTHLEQIIMNLAVNARDAMPKGGTLTIETHPGEVAENSQTAHDGVPPGSYVRLTISDTGSGIPKEIQTRIFEPFFTTKEAGKGTGLGLSTVYGIVKQNGGHILLDSTVGSGSSFSIYLPAIPHSKSGDPAQPVDLSLPRGTEHVLLVEDEPAVRQLTSLVLESLGYQVTACDHPEEALGYFAKSNRRADLLVTDVIMPGMNGCDLAEAAQKLQPGLRVLFTSGYTSHAILEKHILEPGMPFLQKPFSTQSLAKKIREALEGQ